MAGVSSITSSILMPLHKARRDKIRWLGEAVLKLLPPVLHIVLPRFLEIFSLHAFSYYIVSLTL